MYVGACPTPFHVSPAWRNDRQTVTFAKERRPASRASTITRGTLMSFNPWGKRNPYLSMWLSGANALLGKTRGAMTASARRQTKAAMDEGTRQALAFWGLASRPASTKRRRRR
jgi:hypothetical protein